jgi:2'-5' RNA ligase
MLERLFLAIEIPNEVKDSFIPVIGEVKKFRGKVVPLENIHLTVKFIGETDKRDGIIKSLLDSNLKKFSLSLKGVGVFPNVNNPRVFWIGVEGSEGLKELFNFVESRLYMIGIPKDDRPFSPHITLSRFNFLPSVGLSRVIDDYRNFDFGSYEVDNFHLFKSDLNRSHPIYTKLYTFPLI